MSSGRRSNPRPQVEFRDDPVMERGVLTILARGSAGVWDLWQETGVHEKRLVRVLEQLRSRGVVVKQSRRRWALAGRQS